MAKEVNQNFSNQQSQDCNNCLFRIASIDEVAKLRAKNESLLKEQSAMFLMYSLTIDAIGLWGQQNGIIGADEAPTEDFANRHKEISELLSQTQKTEMEVLANRLIDFLNKLECHEKKFR